jgi:hypothetical protein
LLLLPKKGTCHVDTDYGIPSRNSAMATDDLLLAAKRGRWPRGSYACKYFDLIPPPPSRKACTIVIVIAINM